MRMIEKPDYGPQDLAELTNGQELEVAVEILKQYRKREQPGYSLDAAPLPIEPQRPIEKELLREISFILGPAGKPCNRCHGSGREP